MCVICKRCLYKKGVKIFNESDYEIDMKGLIFQVNKKNNICHACHKTLKKGRMECRQLWSAGSFKQLKNSI